mmetsp:Transcript_32186/g.36597  ORF Transcript_32186/g.36597 Transcript_32186/m.36597 type:complete len:240 (-) Transcript_32186:58-777(-)
MMTESEVLALPSLILQLNGDEEYNRQTYPDQNNLPETAAAALDPDHPYDVLHIIPPSHYMEKIKNSKVYVPRLYTDDFGVPIIGANGMMGHDIYFDIEGQRIGWAESNCNYHNLLQENGFNEAANPSSKKTTQTNSNNDDDKKMDNVPSNNDNSIMPKQYVPDTTRIKPSHSIKNTVIGALFGSVTVVALGLLGIRILRKNQTVYQAVAGPVESEMRDLSLLAEDDFPVRRQYEVPSLS